MRPIKVIAAVALLLAGCAVSFCVGRNYEYHQFGERNFEAACLQADFIRYLIDHFDGETECANIGSEIEECYYEYFQDLDNGEFGTKEIRDIRDFEEYYWCY